MVVVEPACHRVQSPPKESSDVLDDDATRLELLDDAGVLPPQAGALSVEAGSLAGEAEVLARKPPAQDFDRRRVEVSDIGVPRGIGPVAGEYRPAEGVYLTLPHHFADTGEFEAEFQPTDAAEQRAYAHGTLRPGAVAPVAQSNPPESTDPPAWRAASSAFA
jgi:hypothetical protein